MTKFLFWDAHRNRSLANIRVGLTSSPGPFQSALGEIALRWIQLEWNIRVLYNLRFRRGEAKPVMFGRAFAVLTKKKIISKDMRERIDAVRKIRNEALHGGCGLNIEALKQASKITCQLGVEIAGECHS